MNCMGFAGKNGTTLTSRTCRFCSEGTIDAHHGSYPLRRKYRGK